MQPAREAAAPQPAEEQPPPVQSKEPSPPELAQQACTTYDSLTGRVVVDGTDTRLLRETLHDAREQALAASRADAMWGPLYLALVNASMFRGKQVTGDGMTEDEFDEAIAAFESVTAECARAGVRLTGT